MAKPTSKKPARKKALAMPAHRTAKLKPAKKKARKGKPKPRVIRVKKARAVGQTAVVANSTMSAVNFGASIKPQKPSWRQQIKSVFAWLFRS